LLVDGASAVAKRLGISELVIGLTIVAFGTSAPELFVNIVASIRGTAGIAIGNVVGSNIANIMLALGIAAIIITIKVTEGTIHKEIPFSILASFIMLFLVNTSQVITRSTGIIFILFLLVFLYYSFVVANEKGKKSKIIAKTLSLSTGVSLFFIGLVFLSVGGKLTVDSAVKLASNWGISQHLIALTIIAIGTSLPEIVTSIVAALKEHHGIAIGNVVGSNILNVFLVLGVSSIIRPIPLAGKNNLDISALIIASILLWLFILFGKRHTLRKWQGIVFICLYVAFITYRITQGEGISLA